MAPAVWKYKYLEKGRALGGDKTTKYQEICRPGLIHTGLIFRSFLKLCNLLRTTVNIRCE
jgi:hypothetical protein